jgi:hypothetical protein
MQHSGLHKEQPRTKPPNRTRRIHICHLLFHQACAAYRCITLRLGVGKSGVKGIDVSLHGALHLLRLLLLLSKFGGNISLQSLDVGNGPVLNRSDN